MTAFKRTLILMLVVALAALLASLWLREDAPAVPRPSSSTWKPLGTSGALYVRRGKIYRFYPDCTRGLSPQDPKYREARNGCFAELPVYGYK